ncbi:NPCBM/NEW2 domain-containing protein [Microbispora sp. CA-135349]|uniref:NPCBM/NEW2 domain-containing protein n=1 Tax=Microbispora sp. CA-135349 TaxID=3239953 RepID=UPI003D8C20B8
MAHPSEAPAKPSARLLPQAVGVVADVAAVAALLAGGGVAIVWTASFGAVVAGVYLVWRRWGEQVDRTLLAGFVIAVAGAGVFGYATATRTSQDAGSPSSAQKIDEGGAAASLKERAAEERTGAAPPAGASWLVDMEMVEGGQGWERGSRTVGAEVFPHSVVGSTCFSTYDQDASFNLGRRFRRFQATVGLPDDAATGSVTRFTVSLEDRQLFSRDLRLGERARVDVPVTGGLRLVLRVQQVGLTDCGAAVWGEALLR